MVRNFTNAWSARRVFTLAVLTTILAGSGQITRATVPVNPLPTPLYSFDANSCQVVGMPPDCQALFKPADILDEGPLVGPALVFVPAAHIGLGANGDVLNSLSFANSSWNPADPFTVLFSIDGDSVGAADPEPTLVAACRPFNAKDQATRGTQAGDLYMSTLEYQLAGGGPQANRQLALMPNNILVLNNYDEGGTDYKANPPGGANSNAFFLARGIAEDEVSSSAYQNGPTPASMPVTRVYFTVRPGSPSLNGLSNPQPASGANIFFVQNPMAPPHPPGTVTMFATPAQLGLNLTDIIDALVVFDLNNNGIFDGTDEVLFSLANGLAKADVFRKRAGNPLGLLVAAANLGLAAADNIDALEILPCDDPETCALDHGIRGYPEMPGCAAIGIPTTSAWGIFAFVLSVVVAGTIVLRNRGNSPVRQIDN